MQYILFNEEDRLGLNLTREHISSITKATVYRWLKEESLQSFHDTSPDLIQDEEGERRTMVRKGAKRKVKTRTKNKMKMKTKRMMKTKMKTKKKTKMTMKRMTKTKKRMPTARKRKLAKKRNGKGRRHQKWQRAAKQGGKPRRRMRAWRRRRGCLQCRRPGLKERD